MLRPLLLLLVLALPLAPAQAQDVPADRIGTESGTIQVGPTFLRLGSGERFNTPNGIARALEFAAPGARIDVLPGAYPPLKIGFTDRDPNTSRTLGGRPGAPIVVRGRPGVRLEHQGRGDTLSISQVGQVGHIHFEDLEIVPGYRAGIIFYDLPDQLAHTGFHFYDVSIVGQWNHATGTGEKSKWGVLGHDLADFVFAGRVRRPQIRDIRLEHAFYLQNPRGDMRIENIDAMRLGRTFVQLTARARSGPPGRGLIQVRNNKVSDIGLSPGDAHKGGSAFTFAGRLEFCTILVEKNTYRAGFDESLRHLTKGNQPYGTGALVAWAGGESRPNGNLVLRGNDFEMAEGAGDRALVTLGSCERVSVEGDNRFVAGAFGVALELKPLVDEQRESPEELGRLFLAEGVETSGQVRLAGRKLGSDTRAELAVPFAEREQRSDAAGG